MPRPDALPDADAGPPAAFAAADLQDHLLVAANDLERLQALLGDACAALLAGFNGAHAAAAALGGGADTPPARSLRSHLAAAVTALQFHDMATQLIVHTRSRLQHCTDRLGAEAFGGDDDGLPALVGALPPRANPVTQAEMDAGSVELF